MAGMIAPLFRCLPSNPKERIVLARKRTADTFPACRSFEHAMMGSGIQCWADCKTLVSIYNQAIRDVLCQR